VNLDAQILLVLRNLGGSAISAADLASQLGVGRSTIAAHIADLRRHGFDIPASPHGGYRLVGTPEYLNADDIVSRLGKPRVVGRDIRVFKETTSTNDVIEKLARDGVAEGVVAFAESQTLGRGRLGRRWFSPAGKGLWFSVLLRPKLTPQQTTQITVSASVALARAVETVTGLSPKIKWPNDLLVNGRKVAGILTELAAEQDVVRHVVVGIGIDVNIEPHRFPPELKQTATSLSIEAGHVIDRAELGARILRELDDVYSRIMRREFEAVAEEWETKCSTVGKLVVVTIGDRRVRGRAEALNSEGALLLRTEHGHLESITGGDVIVEK